MQKNKPYSCWIILLLFSLIFLLPVLTGCRGNLAETKTKTTLYLATGGSGSTYASLGQEVAEWINAKSPNLYVVPELSGGPEANLRILSPEGPQLAIVTADLAYYAGEGSEFFQHEAAVAYRLLAMLDVEPLYILCDAGSPWQDGASLKDKNISLGGGGSRNHILVYRLLQGLGFPLDPTTLSFLAQEEALMSLAAENLHAAFLLDPLQGNLAAKTAQFKILPLSQKQEELVQQVLPFLWRARVPKGSFAGQDEELFVPAVPVFLAAAADLPRELVAELAGALKGSPFQWLEAQASSEGGTF